MPDRTSGEGREALVHVSSARDWDATDVPRRSSHRVVRGKLLFMQQRRDLSVRRRTFTTDWWYHRPRQKRQDGTQEVGAIFDQSVDDVDDSLPRFEPVLSVARRRCSKWS